jgi:histidyl-tRNA synthetase
VFCIPVDDDAKLDVAEIAARLRADGVRADVAYGDRGLKAMLRAADRSGASLALIKDDDAAVKVKDLATGEQVDVDAGSVVDAVLARLRG